MFGIGGCSNFKPIKQWPQSFLSMFQVRSWSAQKWTKGLKFQLLFLRYFIQIFHWHLVGNCARVVRLTAVCSVMGIVDKRTDTCTEHQMKKKKRSKRATVKTHSQADVLNVTYALLNHIYWSSCPLYCAVCASYNLTSDWSRSLNFTMDAPFWDYS